LKSLWIRIVQSYLTLGFRFYYKKYNAVHLEKIPENKAIIFLSNHQNALLDPLLITIKSKQQNYFLTRAVVFKNPTIAKILNSFQMLPVYRMIDGVNTIKKNKQIFTKCTELLNKNESIILFPEGNHNLKRKVRPLKKGFLRIINETLQKYPTTEIIIIPVGLNYQNATKWGDSMTVIFGNHISPNTYWNNDELDFLGLSNAVSEKLKQLTTHIESIKKYDNSLEKLNKLEVDFTNPVEVNKCLENNFNYKGKKVSKASNLFLFLKSLVKIFYFLPYFIWKKFALPSIKDDEFIATFRYALILTLVPIFLLIEVLIVSIAFNSTTGGLLLSIGLILPLVALRAK